MITLQTLSGDTCRDAENNFEIPLIVTHIIFLLF